MRTLIWIGLLIAVVATLSGPDGRLHAERHAARCFGPASASRPEAAPAAPLVSSRRATAFATSRRNQKEAPGNHTSA